MLVYDMTVLFALIQLLLTSALVLLAQQVEEVLFVLHDAGESLAFKPVIDVLLKDSNVNISILCLGEPSTSLYSEYSNSFVLDDVGIDIDIEDGTDEARAQMLSEVQLRRLIDSVHPVVGICGMVYGMQAQICSSLRYDDRRNQHSAAATNHSDIDHGRSFSMTFYDGFGLWSNETVMGTYFTNQNPAAVRKVMTSAQVQTESINSDLQGRSPYCSALTTGNPTLQSWKTTTVNVTRTLETRAYLYGDGDNTNIIGVVYAGGYGGEDYTASLSVFCQTALNITKSMEVINEDIENSKMKFVFAPHPGYTSEYESNLFDSWGCLEAILVLPSDSGFSTDELVVASNASLSECSTVGGQSVAVGIPHAYINPSSGSMCTDVFTVNDIIPSVRTVAELESTLLATFKSWDYYVDPVVLEVAGVPVNGTAAILEEIYQHLN